jgi:hypothetical protein
MLERDFQLSRIGKRWDSHLANNIPFKVCEFSQVAAAGVVVSDAAVRVIVQHEHGSLSAETSAVMIQYDNT